MRIKDDRETRKAICSGIIGLIYFEHDHDLYEGLEEIYPQVLESELSNWIREHLKDLSKIQDEAIDFLDQQVRLFLRSTMSPANQLPEIIVTFPQSTIIDFRFQDYIEAEDFLKAHGIADRQIDKETAEHWGVFLSNEQEANFGIT